MIKPLFALCALLLTGHAVAGSWNLSAEQPDGNYLTHNVRQFADDVKAASGGALELKVHSNSTLVKRPEVKRSVQQGIVPIGEVLMSVLGNEDALFEVDNLPFLATSFDESEKLWKLARPLISERLARQGLTLVYGAPWPPQGIYTKTPVKSLVDFKGVKFRAYNASTARLVTLMGAVPATVQSGEVPQAFSTGVIDMMITSPATGVDSQAWDYVKNYYDVRAFVPQSIVIANSKALAALPESDRKVLLEAGARAEARGWKAARERTDALTQTLAARGMAVQPAPAALRTELMKIGETMSAEWLPRAGDDGRKLLDAYRR